MCAFRLHSSYGRCDCMLVEGPAAAVIIICGANREELDYEFLDFVNLSKNVQVLS